MIHFDNYGTQVKGSSKWQVRGRYCTAFVDPPSVTTIDRDTMVKGDKFAPLKWKENLHLKASGVVHPYTGYAAADELRDDWSKDHLYVVGGTYSTDGTLLISGSFGAACWIYASTAVFVIGGISPYGPYHAYISMRVNKSGKRSYWSTSLSVSRGISLGTVQPSEPEYPGDRGAVPLVKTILARSTYRAYNYNYRARTTWYSLSWRAIDVEEFTAKLLHYRVLMSMAVNAEREKHRPELQATSFDAVEKFDGNMLAYLSELATFGQSLPGALADLATSADVRTFARTWLSTRYGDRLSYKDTRELIESISSVFLTLPGSDRFVVSGARQQLSIPFGDDAGSSTATGYVSCKLAIRPKDSNSLMTSVRHLMEWDLFPTLENTWDMIPLSFVVDWFLNVSEIFKSVDRLVQSRYYDVACVLDTAKAEATMPGFPGVTLSLYDRALAYQLSLGVSSVSLGLPSAINVVDGISLILS